MSFVSDSFFFFLTINFSFLSVEGCKRIKNERKKTRITFILKILFWGSRLIYGVGHFPEPVEVVAFPRQVVEIY